MDQLVAIVGTDYVWRSQRGLDALGETLKSWFDSLDRAGVHKAMRACQRWCGAWSRACHPRWLADLAATPDEDVWGPILYSFPEEHIGGQITNRSSAALWASVAMCRLAMEEASSGRNADAGRCEKRDKAVRVFYDLLMVANIKAMPHRLLFEVSRCDARFSRGGVAPVLRRAV